MHWMRRHRRGRPPHPDILTPAEWRVVELVREGHPNADIADRLGITVPTVKSHITSILAKTGLPDRYALAEWDGEPAGGVPATHERGFALPLVGWLGGATTGAKLIGGGVAGAALVGAVFVAFAFLVNADPDAWPAQTSDESVQPFRLEISVEWSNSNPSRAAPLTMSYEWFQQSSSEWRVVTNGHPGWSLAIESAHLDGVLDAPSQVVVADGDHRALFHPGANEYFQGPLGSEGTSQPAPARYRLGPSGADSVDDLVAQLGGSAERIGSARVLDRDTEIIEYDSLPLPGLHGQGQERAAGQLYVDPDTMLVLRHDFEFADSGRVFRSEVTDLEIDAALDTRLFEFTPPPDAREAGTDEACPVMASPTAAPERFLEVPDLPDWSVDLPDWTGSGSASLGPDCEYATFSIALLHPSERLLWDEHDYFVLEQSRLPAGTVPPRLQEGTRIAIGEHEGYHQSEGGAHRLVWSQDSVTVLFESNAFSLEVLLEMAESAELN